MMTNGSCDGVVVGDIIMVMIDNMVIHVVINQWYYLVLVEMMVMIMHSTDVRS